MKTSGQQMVWRESLRKAKKPKQEAPKTCKKLEKHDLRSSVLATISSKSIFKKQAQKYRISDQYSDIKETTSTDCSKIDNFHKELLKNYQEVIKKQEQDLSRITFENNLLTKKIHRLKEANSLVSTPGLIKPQQADPEEKIVNYYKSSIKAAENLLSTMKNEFSNRMAELIQEKSRLDLNQPLTIKID